MKARTTRGAAAGLAAALILLPGTLPPPGTVPGSGDGVVSGQVITPAPSSQAKRDTQRAAEDGKSGVGETWEVLYLGGKRMGYAHTTERRIQRDGTPIVKTSNETRIRAKRAGDAFEMTTRLQTEETAEGNLRSFEFEMRNPPSGTVRSEGRVQDGRLVVKSTVAGRTVEKPIAWRKGIKSPAWLNRVMEQPPIEPGRTRSFEAFLPELQQVVRITVSAGERRSVELLNDERRRLLAVRVTQENLPDIRAFVDERGQIIKTETGLLGQTMATYRVPKEDALKAIAGAELDLAANTLIRVRPIRNAHQTERIVYKITTPGQDAAGLLADGPGQEIRRIDEETVEVTVTARPLPDRARREKADVDAQYLRSSRYVQSDDARVREHARRAAAGATDPARVAGQMERYVHERLTEKNFSTALASAAEVAKDLEGDCTEHAVLLAAMLRAQRIPARIAVGLVYVPRRSAFGGHMWTEAYLDGKWIPLDATLGEGGIGAAHLKLTDAALADDGPAPVTVFLPLLKLLNDVQIEIGDVEPGR